MVDSTKTTVTEQIDTTTPTGLGMFTTTDPELNATIGNFREIQQAILDDINNPQVNPQFSKSHHRRFATPVTHRNL